MPLPRETPEEELRQTVVRLQADMAALRTQFESSTSRDDNSGDNNVPQNPQRIESFYRVPKIPPFFKADPSLWFLQVEALLRNAGISNQVTMADTVIAHLDVEAVSLVSDLITSPDPSIQYTRIKERIVSAFATSSEAKLRQLLKGQVTLDGKPSQILARMRNLSGSSCSDSVLRSIFLECLPEQCRAILAASKYESLQDLAQLADTVVDAIGSTPQYTTSSSAVVPYQAPVSTASIASSSQVSALERKVEEMQKSFDRQINKMLSVMRSRSRSRGRHNSPRPRSRSRSADGICRIHRKYGDKAVNCYKPCAWKPSSDKPSN